MLLDPATPMLWPETVRRGETGVRCVAYRRVSTDRQAERGFGLDVQDEACREWAEANGHEIVTVCTDEGVSGTTDAADRPGLTCVFDALTEGRADALITARLDRLARSVTVQEAILAAVWREGRTVFTADSGEVKADDPDDPTRTAMRQMAAVFAQLDRALIAKRLRDGRSAKAKRGGYAYGSPPFGYRAESGELVEVPAEQKTIRRIRTLHRAGKSTRAIATALNDDGLTTKRGRPWSSSSVSDVLTRGRVAARKASS